MVQYNKYSDKKKGFTLVELIVVLAITAILAAMVGGGLIAYARLARFEKNESNARTLFQAAQISLTRMDTAGELDAFRDTVGAQGSIGDHFAAGLTDEDGNELAGRTQKDMNTYIAALYYDKSGAADGNHNALIEQLLGDYIYDESLLNAAICVEIDVQSGQVYSVFYDSGSDKLRFNTAGATNIYDRSYSHRRNDSLVGYYSAEDRVNVVQLQQTKLKVKNPRLTNGETLTLSWSGNSSLNDLDTTYLATAYAKTDTSQSRPLFEIKIERNSNDTADGSKQVMAKMDTVLYKYDAAGSPTRTEAELTFPLSYNRGSFVLTLDAMADANLLRAAENSSAVADSSLYSITRLLNNPQDIYIVMQAKPRSGYDDTYTPSKEESTNVENTLLAKESTAKEGELKYFRHLYNLRWADQWEAEGERTYTLVRQSQNSTGLNWTGGGVTIYCAAGETGAVAKVPSAKEPVAWPTIPTLGENITLDSETALVGGATRVPIQNLQLRSNSVAKAGRKTDKTTDVYVGLIGENKGTIQNLTLRDVDAQINAEIVTVAAADQPGENELKLSNTKMLQAFEMEPTGTDTTDWQEIHAVGALCGVNTGTLEKCALTRGTNSTASSVVAAALSFGDETTAMERVERESALTDTAPYYENEPRGIGGLVGFAVPAENAEMKDLTVDTDVTVAGLFVDTDTAVIHQTTAEKDRYANVAADADESGSVWRAIGTGGVFGVLDAANMTTDAETNIQNNAFVTGNGFVGGIAGGLFNTGDSGESHALTGLTNNGTVSAGANYKGNETGAGHSAVLGQFFGGLAGYGRDVTLNGCYSATRKDLTESQLKEQIKNGFAASGTQAGALLDSSPLKGDFVGGLVGFGKNLVLDNCVTGKGYVLGRSFVGGLAGGFTGSSAHENGTNGSDVFGNRYVGGIVSVNGSQSHIVGMTNNGLVAAFGSNAAYVGGIAGVNDSTWGKTKATNAAAAATQAAGTTIAEQIKNDPRAMIVNCANQMSGDNATDTRRINLLQELSKDANGKSAYADYVGGIAGCNGAQGVVEWRQDGGTNARTISLGAILHGGSYVGGVVGYNDETASILNDTTAKKTISIRGQVAAEGKAVGGFIGLNCASELPAVTVAATRIEGSQLVGGVIGANLPVNNFSVKEGGTLVTDVASGTVTADAVAGGIIGYNRLLAAKPMGLALESLLPVIDKTTGVLTDSTAVNTADTEVVFAGFTNKLNLNADTYVGGIVGCNDSRTKLTIQNAVNGSQTNALSVGGVRQKNDNAQGVQLDALADNRYSFEGEDGYLAGGIIGYASGTTTLESCTNYGTIGHKRAAGGLAGWNEGTITSGSMEASLGNRQNEYRYLGGIVGVNAGTVVNTFPQSSRAIRGERYVGGVSGANILGGAIRSTQAVSGASVEATNYAGGVTGLNAGRVELSGGAVSVAVNAVENYAGGAAGRNTDTGVITGTATAYGAISGRVSAVGYAGGAAGRNSGSIDRMENQASVRVSGQYAGGLVGSNDAKAKISRSCHTAGEVYATSGMAGGIAGINNAGANIENVQVQANVTAANGTAGGITATNYGTIGAANKETDGSVSGCTITGTAESIGVVAAYNQTGAVIRNIRLAEDANVLLSTPATNIGGLVGTNTGSIEGCTVENNVLNLSGGLRAGANTITLGGAAGKNTSEVKQEEVKRQEYTLAVGTIRNTDVQLNITDNLDKYVNLGGVAGQNGGTLVQCTYKGTIGGTPNSNGLVQSGAASIGSTVGGIAGRNIPETFTYTVTENGEAVTKSLTQRGRLENCEVKAITLQVSGVSNVTATQTAAEKMENASHVGGIVGRNETDVANCYVATEKFADRGSVITARYGFVGGVAGTNNGTITGSGSRQAFEAVGENKGLVPQITEWLAQTEMRDGQEVELSAQEKYDRLNAMVKELKSGTVYSGLKGIDTVESNQSVYGDGLNTNMLLVALRGRTRSDVESAEGYLGGLVGFNGLNGSIESSATGKWFVYGDNISAESSMGGIIGQNETNAALNTLVNCAAVRRFICVNGVADDGSNQKDSIVAHLGGIIGSQQNRSGDQWSIVNAVNYGSLYNSRSSHIGGVLGYWSYYGGLVQRCFNFGRMKVNTNPCTNTAYGTVGGIVGTFDNPVSGVTTNILSCQNHGDIVADSGDRRANDCGGIVGKFNLLAANKNDYMVLNIIDCVNGKIKIQARSMATGILSWIGDYVNINNVEVNIDRCRNYGTEYSYVSGVQKIAGIVGNRGDGSRSDAATKVTNCFSLAKKENNWFPIAFIKYDRNPAGENLTGSANNFFMDANSFRNAANAVLGRDANAVNAVSDWGSPNTSDDNSQASIDANARRLYAGTDTGDTEWSYFAVLPGPGSNGKGNWNYNTDNIKQGNAYILENPTNTWDRVIWGKTQSGTTEQPEELGTIKLRFKDADGSKSASINDIEDEVIQNYYIHVLDVGVPAAPTGLVVHPSTTEIDNKVYGRYEVKWDAPATDKEHGPASYYHVEVLQNGNVLREAYVYDTRYTFDNTAPWSGEFQVRVTACNTAGNGGAAEKTGLQFAQALPTPQIEVRLVRQQGIMNDYSSWNENNTFAFEQVVVLKNYDAYVKSGAKDWKVTVVLDKNKDEGTNKARIETFTFSADKTTGTGYTARKVVRHAMGGGSDNKNVVKITAVAETPSTDTEWMRSEQYNESAYIPSAWIGAYKSQSPKENGFAPGTLTTKEVSFSGNTIENLKLTAKLNFNPEYDTQGTPTYRVMLIAKYLGDDAITLDGESVSLKDQYVTLAAQQRRIPNADTEIVLSSLPADTLENYTDWTVIAVPADGGLGDVVTRWNITKQEAADTIKTYKEDAWWKAGLEIVRSGSGYEYATLTPLCLVDTNHTEVKWWADNVQSVVARVNLKDNLGMNVLPAPTLAQTIDEGVVDDKNELTYTFTWKQNDLASTDAAPEYTIKLYGLITDSDGNAGQEEIPLADGVTLTPEQNGNQFTLKVNVDTMLANGSDSWHYDKVRLQVTRVPSAQDTTQIGSSASMEYEVKQRLPKISAPGSIMRVNGETDNANSLLYDVSWSPANNAKIDHYVLYAVERDGTVVGTWEKSADAANPGVLRLDLEQYQGQELRFYVKACKAETDTTCYDGPNGDMSQSETIVTRAAAPVVVGSAFEQTSPNQETFLNNLKLDATLDTATQDNIYFTGYIFSNVDDYKAIQEKVTAWNNAAVGDAKYQAQQELTAALAAMLQDGRAELVINADQNLGESANVSGTQVSYTFVPGEQFSLTPDHAKQYLLPAVRVMPTDGSTPSNWTYILKEDAAQAQLPAIELDTPVNADEPQRALGSRTYTQNVSLYTDPNFTTGEEQGALDLTRFTVEWTAANAYKGKDGDTVNLTDRYAFTVTPMAGEGSPYTVQVITYAKETTDQDGTVHPRGEIKSVTKTIDGYTHTIDLQTETDAETGETRVWYDLSMEPVLDADGNVTEWNSAPKTVRGTVEQDGRLLYYKAPMVPMLELVQEDGAEPVYRITLPELQSKLRDDELDLQKFTARVALQTLACTEEDVRGENAKTTASDEVAIIVNETNEASLAQELPEQEIPVAEEPAVQSIAEPQPVQGEPLPAATPETAEPNE